MSKAGCGVRPRFLTHVAAASAALLLAFVGSAGAARSLPAPLGFKVRASDGYTLSVLGVEDLRTGREVVFITMSSPHAEVFYGAPASIGPTSIEADLGAIGRIDVDFVPSGQPRVEHSACGGKPVAVDSGHYEGTIDFEGELGYSKVHANSAQGNMRMFLNIVCPGGPSLEGSGGHSPGARLTVKHGGPRRFEFTAMKNSPTRPARFTASVREKRGGLLILRAVEITAAPGSFDFDVPSGEARVRPPEPFAGEASYLRPPGKKSQWSGDLSVDFPGRVGVGLTGPGTRASMIRAVLNPGQIFRVP